MAGSGDVDVGIGDADEMEGRPAGGIGGDGGASVVGV